MDNLTNSKCCFCLISVARNVTGTPLSTRSQQCSFSDGSRTRQMFVYADNTYCFSADTREFAPPEFADVSDNACMYCTEYTEGFTRRVFQNSYFNKYTEHQIRSSHGSRARRDETRVSYCSSTRRDQARTSHCVREETKRLRTAPSARTKQEDRFARLNVRGHKLVLGRVYKAGSVR